MAEEANELAGICARIMEQGLDGINPSTGKHNRDALMEEMSDVRACMDFQMTYTGIMYDGLRMQRKLGGYYQWFRMIDDIIAAEEEGKAFDDYKGWYDAAMIAANAAGYSGMDAASVITALDEDNAALRLQLSALGG